MAPARNNNNNLLIQAAGLLLHDAQDLDEEMLGLPVAHSAITQASLIQPGR